MSTRRPNPELPSNDGTHVERKSTAERMAESAIEREMMARRQAVRREALVQMIGARIAAAQKGASIDSLDLCTATGIHPRTLQRYRTGNTVSGPDAADIKALAIALRVTPEWLAWGAVR